MKKTIRLYLIGLDEKEAGKKGMTSTLFWSVFPPIRSDGEILIKTKVFSLPLAENYRLVPQPMQKGDIDIINEELDSKKIMKKEGRRPLK